MKGYCDRQQAAPIFLSLLFFCLAGCGPLIGPYSPTAYKNATFLKAETLALMDKATEPYPKHEKKVESLMVRISEAYEYVHGIPSDDLSARQWDILRNPEGDLLGRFFSRWKSGSTLSRVYITEFRKIMSDAFDEIICLEANKKSARICLK